MNHSTHTDPVSVSEHVIAFDYGLKYIGSAVGSIETGLAQPLRTVGCKGGRPDWASIEELVAVWQPNCFIVGRPEARSPARLLENLDAFVKQLQRRFALPVNQMDEHLSSAEAYHKLKTQRTAGRRGKIARADIDKVAAALILESWLATQIEVSK